MIHPVIMAGGAGTRLWPLSRSNYPKQFLALTGKNTMLQDTVLRLANIDYKKMLFICNEEHRFMAAEQVRQLNLKGETEILLEPVGRNTAPAITLAALRATENSEDPILLVLPADHVVENTDAFQNAISKASSLASEGKLVTFGVVPTKPETGYGYINRGNATGSSSFEVKKFVEKPSKEVAIKYLESGDYYWNSGMFMFKASRFLEEIKKYREDIYEVCERAIAESITDMDFLRVNSDVFLSCPSESIDYAVMEKTDDAVVVPLEAGWSDVGGFMSLWEASEKSDNGNVFLGDVVSHETKNTFVHAQDKLVATVGVENLVIINTKDALLVAEKNSAQEVKSIVNMLKATERTEVNSHREVYRPWGKYDSVDVGERFQVKRITVKPGAKLSVQMHHHRAEHWVVVSGTALVTVDGKERLLTENESVYIPINSVHALENPGKLPLELIEVQSGSYLGEDDIVRFEDRYGRIK